MSNKKIVLASQSPRRRELLGGLIKDFDIIADKSEEVINPDMTPEEIVKSLALEKAENVAKIAGDDALVIGADTVVCIDGKILGKPKDESEAKEMLGTLSGREHHVCTGFALVDNASGKRVCDFERTVVRFKTLTETEIERYIQSGEPMDKAGAYGIQGVGALFVEGIKGDYFNVVGLPICALFKSLKENFNYEV